MGIGISNEEEDYGITVSAEISPKIRPFWSFKGRGGRLKMSCLNPSLARGTLIKSEHECVNGGRWRRRKWLITWHELPAGQQRLRLRIEINRGNDGGQEAGQPRVTGWKKLLRSLSHDMEATNWWKLPTRVEVEGFMEHFMACVCLRDHYYCSTVRRLLFG